MTKNLFRVKNRSSIFIVSIVALFLTLNLNVLNFELFNKCYILPVEYRIKNLTFIYHIHIPHCCNYRIPFQDKMDTFLLLAGNPSFEYKN